MSTLGGIMQVMSNAANLLANVASDAKDRGLLATRDGEMSPPGLCLHGPHYARYDLLQLTFLNMANIENAC